MREPFQTKKSLGQHFLNSHVVPRWMCDAANLQPGETVVEIGPGTGALTRELLARGVIVIALEADRRAITVLEKNFSEALETRQLLVSHIDARTHTPAELGLATLSFKVVANIPYYLSGLLFRTYLSTNIQPNTLVFLVQKEVAKRITSSISRGEKESLLSLSVKAFGNPEYVTTVSRGHFTPPPKVDSAIIAVRNIDQSTLAGVVPETFFDLLHLGFGQKRKQLLGNLTAVYERDSLHHVFTELGIAPDARAEDLPLDTWLSLVHALSHQ